MPLQVLSVLAVQAVTAMVTVCEGGTGADHGRAAGPLCGDQMEVK